MGMAIPRAKDDQCAGVLEDWLDVQSFDGASADVDGDYLRAISALALVDAPEAELAEAVKRAKEHGWSWTPIALVLGTTRKHVVKRFSRAIGHPVTSRLPRQRR
jgi:16S rRNA U516 pseudouridylate synthase RsuA-like enzyme